MHRVSAQALSLLDEMAEEGIPPNTVTYNSAIDACGKAGQWEKALELLVAAASAGIQQSPHTVHCPHGVHLPSAHC